MTNEPQAKGGTSQATGEYSNDANMTLNQLITRVQRAADTPKTQINASEVSRVVSLTLTALAEHMTSLRGCAEGLELIERARKNREGMD